MSNKNQSSSTFVGPVVSCGNIVIYQMSEDRKSYVKLFIDISRLDLKESNRLTVNSQYLKVRMERYAEDISSILCNDIRQAKPSRLDEIEAVSGSLLLEMTKDDVSNCNRGLEYRCRVQITDLKFQDSDKSYKFSVPDVIGGVRPG